MQVTFACASCQTHLAIEATAAGAEIRCPQCQVAQIVPRIGPGPGATVGGFRITKLIGKGGMGEVYLARQLSLDRDIALKILPHAITTDKENVERFLKEVRVLAKLEHPNIVTAYEAGVDDGVHYLAMGYVRGETLEDCLKKRGAFAEAEALRLIAKLAAAMGYAWHKHQLIHRDIKPANVILDETGEPKLADLGLTKSLGESGGLTMSGTIMGTPSYMSPEQVDGKDNVDFHADIYALGATLYHMLTGQIPFAATTLMESLRKQATERLPDPRQFVPTLSEGCVRVLARMLAKDPTDRYPSWQSLSDDLQRVSTGQTPASASLAAGKSAMLVRKSPNAGLSSAPSPRRSTQTSGVAAVRTPPAAERVAARQEGAESQARRVATLVTVALLVATGAVCWRIQRGKQTHAGASSVVPAKASSVSPVGLRTAGVPPPVVAQEVPHVAPAPVVTSAVASAGDRIAAVAKARGEANARADVAERRRLAASNAVASAAASTSAIGGSLPHGSGPAPRPGRPGAAEGGAPVPGVTEWTPAATLDRLADCVLTQDWEAAMRLVQETDQEPRAKECSEWGAVKTAVCEVARMPMVILESLASDKGRQVVVMLKSGDETLQIGEISEGKCKADKLFEVDGRVAGRAPRVFGVDDLSVKEKLKRLGVEKTSARQVMRGLLAWEVGSPDAALRLFRESGGPEGAWLVARVERLLAARADAKAAAAKAAQEQAAESHYTALLQDAGLLAERQSEASVVRDLRKKRFTEGEVQKLRQDRAAFLGEHANTEVGARVRPVIAVLGQIRPNVSLDVDRSVVEAAMDALQKANPNELFARKPIYLPDGIRLELGGMKGLKDISAIEGLPIVELTLNDTEVPDLRPLTGMPLRMLRAGGTRIADLRPLTGMPLQELLLGSTPVKDLRPLAGMALTELRVSSSQVTDLGPLRGMPLVSLMVEWCGIGDLSPLHGMPLKKLSVAHTYVTDLKPLEGMALTELHIENTGVSDLGPLRGMPLTWLTMSWTKVTDLGPLRGMPLSRIEIGSTGVSDLSPLTGMPLTRLGMPNTRVRDMRPVKDIPDLVVYR